MENRQMEENQPKEQCSRMDQIDLGDFHEWLVFPHEKSTTLQSFAAQTPIAWLGKSGRFLQ